MNRTHPCSAAQKGLFSQARVMLMAMRGPVAGCTCGGPAVRA
ncbi:MAG: hypothetical protein U0636_01120 [Phycisphaerales bacterium]